MTITFTLNGARRVVEAEAGEPVQRLLQRIGIPSVRDSDDGEGFAGSDTILLDGKPALACLMVAAQLEGRAVETVESLSAGGELSAIQSAMLDAGVVQSAYNSPAAALLIAELLRRRPDPTEEEVRDALSGLFSRSTGYRKFLLVVRLARERLAAGAAGTAPPAPAVPEFGGALRLVGKARRRIDGVQLVTGRRAYVEDRLEPGCCVMKVLRSPHAHASIRSIDTAAAEQLAGVVAVFTYRNSPDIQYGSAGQSLPEPSPYDRRLFDRRLRHVGDRVAAVVAEDAGTAARALSMIAVDYEVLEPVLSIDEAQAAKAPLVHPEPIVWPLAIGADPSRNLAASVRGGIGDEERGFAEADVVIERTYQTSRVQPTPLEPHVVCTRMDGDRLVVHASTQVPYFLRRIVARVLGIGEHRVRVIKERVGGGFGTKQDILLEELCAYATFTTGRPVYYKYTREEEFIAGTVRHPLRMTVRMGAKRDGTLTAIRLRVDADTGAYGNHCLTVPMNACSKSLPLLRCPNVSFDVRSWYTNHVPSGAYQGYGAPQGAFAIQMAAAELAAELGMDQLAFLERTMVRNGDVLEILRSLGEGREGAAVRVQSSELDRAVAEGKAAFGWASAVSGRPPGWASAVSGRPPAAGGVADPDVKVGRGAVIIQQGSGLPGLDQSCANVTLLTDGTFLVRSGGADLGTGLDTVLAKLAAETLACDLERVAVVSGDTDTTPFDKGAFASSGTFFTGNAGLAAARDLARQLLEAGARMLGEPLEGVRLEHPGRVVGGRGAVDYAAIAQHRHSGEGAGELCGRATFTTEEAAIPYAAHFCEVAVSERTGSIEVRRYLAVHDSGTVINPELAAVQVEAAVVKSLGHALYEEMVFDRSGHCLTTRLADYGAPMVQEVPRELEVRLLAADDRRGPFGAKSISEISMNGAAPAVAIAVHAAVGAWIRDWPITPEKVLRALRKL